MGYIYIYIYMILPLYVYHHALLHSNQLVWATICECTFVRIYVHSRQDKAYKTIKHRNKTEIKIKYD